MKKILTKSIVIGSVITLQLSNSFAQVNPWILDSTYFPRHGDTAWIHSFTVPVTQTYIDSAKAISGDTLSIDEILDLALLESLGDNDMAGMADNANCKDKNWVVHKYYYNNVPTTKLSSIKYLKYDKTQPGANTFKKANLYYTFRSYSNAAAQWYTAYVYLIVDKYAYYELGTYADLNSGIILNNKPQKPIVKFPLDFCNPNNVSSKAEAALKKQPIKISGGLPVVAWYNVTVDSYGKLTLDTGKDVGTPDNIVYDLCMRTVTEELDTFSLDAVGVSGGRMYVHAKQYNYYVPGVFDPVVSYTVSKQRNNLDPSLWVNFPDFAWKDEVKMTYLTDYNGYSDRITTTHPECMPAASCPPPQEVGIEEEKEKENTLVQISPNPSSGKFNLSFNKTSKNPVNIEVYDILGKVVYQKSNIQSRHIGTTFNIDLSNQHQGLYLMRIKSDTEVITKKIIIN